MTIHKYFENQQKANDYYLKLCDNYNSVKLVGWPFSGEAGNYSFEVKD
jgi:hypothetical protein